MTATRLSGTLFLGCLAICIAGCVIYPPYSPPTTDERTIGDYPANPNLGRPLVRDWREACEVMAGDLVMSAVVQTAQNPLVIEIKPVENNTGVAINTKIIPQTIRAKIMELGPGKIVFRDETSREDVATERFEQSDSPVVISKDTVTRHQELGKAVDPFGVPKEKLDKKTKTIHEGKQETVTTKRADVDYFLKGFVAAENETSAGQSVRGMRYFQFQCRLTDARTGTIAWEKMCDVKREGDIRPAPWGAQ